MDWSPRLDTGVFRHGVLLWFLQIKEQVPVYCTLCEQCPSGTRRSKQTRSGFTWVEVTTELQVPLNPATCAVSRWETAARLYGLFGGFLLLQTWPLARTQRMVLQAPCSLMCGSCGSCLLLLLCVQACAVQRAVGAAAFQAQ